MPRAGTVCKTPGCPDDATRNGWCDGHWKAKRKAADRSRPTAAARGYDARWQATRAEHIRLEPKCRRCDAPATDVDHIDGLGPNGPRGHDHANLQSLCHACHSSRTATDSGYGRRMT